MIDRFWQDLRQAWRSLNRARAFSAAVAATFALGMAGAISMFALIEGILLRPLAVPNEGQLVVGWRQLSDSASGHWPFRTMDIDTLRAGSRRLESIAGVGYNDPSPLALVDGGSVTFVQGARVGGDFFRVLGAGPALGRTLTARDDVTGAENVLVITYGLWQRRYGGSRDVLGRRLTFGGQPFTIVGVMPADVEYPRGVEAWATVAAMQTTTSNPTFRNAMRDELDLVARMRPGATLAQSAAELRSMAPILEAQREPGEVQGIVPVLASFKESLVGDVRPALAVLFGAVGLVLFVACANAASLMLSRGVARRSEFAVRAALGGSRARMVRQMLLENLMLAAAAGAAGWLASRLALRAWLGLVPGGLPRTDGIEVGGVAVLFAFALAVLVATATGLVPALSSARVNLSAYLRDGRTHGPAARRGSRLLVVTQVAVAVVVVAAAALLGRSLLTLQSTGGRLATDRLLLVSLALPQHADRARRVDLMNQLVERLETVPGVAAATPVNATPFSGLGWDVPTYTAEGQARERATANPSLNLEEIHPNYFKAFELPLVRGRTFTTGDRDGAPLVAIVSEDVARRTWPGQDPIGKRIKMGDADSRDPWRTVVGVVAPTRYRELREPRASIYVPAAQLQGAARDVVVRSSSPPAAVAELLRAQVLGLDGEIQVERIRPFAELLEVPLARPRFNALLVTVFAAVALALLTVGLYAVIAAFVRQRRAEIGLRMALGATVADIHRLVLGEGLRLAGAGAVLGFAAAIASARALRGLLFGIEPLDPWALGAAALLLAAAAILSLYGPARAAGRVEPATALRA